MSCMIASFNFNLENFASLEEAERHYVEYHVPLARRLPGLRHHVIGRAVDFGPSVADRHRAALLAFDDADALRAAYRSDVGRELRADKKQLIAVELDLPRHEHLERLGVAAGNPVVLRAHAHLQPPARLRPHGGPQLREPPLERAVRRLVMELPVLHRASPRGRSH